MEIYAYLTRDGNISVTVFGSMTKLRYHTIINPKELPLVPGFAEHPFALAILHAFSEQEQAKWKA